MSPPEFGAFHRTAPDTQRPAQGPAGWPDRTAARGPLLQQPRSRAFPGLGGPPPSPPGTHLPAPRGGRSGPCLAVTQRRLWGSGEAGLPFWARPRSSADLPAALPAAPAPSPGRWGPSDTPSRSQGERGSPAMTGPGMAGVGARPPWTPPAASSPRAAPRAEPPRASGFPSPSLRFLVAHPQRAHFAAGGEGLGRTGRGTAAGESGVSCRCPWLPGRAAGSVGDRL